MSVRLRPARDADAPAAARLLDAAGLCALDDTAQFGPNYVVAEDAAGAVVGMAGVEVHGDWGLLRSVTVDAGMRGSGLGQRLAADRIAWARTRGLRELWLLTVTAQEFFPKLGFTVAARDEAPPEIAGTLQWAAMCPSSSTAMRLFL